MEEIKIPDYKKIRVLIDTDAACEADDPFAIVQALLSPKLIVRGILAEHFNEKGSVARSYEEVLTVLRAMGKEGDIPVLMGQDGGLDQDENVSEAASFIIKEAMGGTGSGASSASGGTASAGFCGESFSASAGLSDPCDSSDASCRKSKPAPWDEKPLYILCQGAVTNVAMALRQCPAIKDKIIVIWIGTHGTASFASAAGSSDSAGSTSASGSFAGSPAPASFAGKPAPYREYNAGNDITAANELLESGAQIWLIPSYVYKMINVGLAELKSKVAPCGEIGRHLYENMVSYNLSSRAGWTQGESWTLGDSPAVAAAINPECGTFISVRAPHISDDTDSVFKADNPLVREYTYMDSRYILEDFFAKLSLNYPPQK